MVVYFLHICRLYCKLPKGSLTPEHNNHESNILQQLSKNKLTGVLNQLQPLLLSEGYCP